MKKSLVQLALNPFLDGIYETPVKFRVPDQSLEITDFLIRYLLRIFCPRYVHSVDLNIKEGATVRPDHYKGKFVPKVAEIELSVAIFS